MILQELAYKVTIRADEFLNGKREVSEEARKLDEQLSRGEKERQRELSESRREMEKFGKAAHSAFSGAYTAAAGFLGIGAGLYGIKQLFTSTADEIVRASQQARFFGSDVNKMFGVRRGFEQAGLNGDAFIASSGSARMALANIKDPTIFGGLTGEAQNLMTIGARTGLNINQLGDPSKALAEFTRYSKTHSQENLMQVMSAVGFDPTDASKIKSGELKALVDSETKKSNITAAQVKEQEKLLETIGQLSAEFSRLRQDIAMAFAPEVIAGMRAFGEWIRDHHGDIIGFFKGAGDVAKKFTDAVGEANALLLLLAVGLRANPLVLGAMAAASAVNSVDNIVDAVKEKDGTDSFIDSLFGRLKAGGWANWEAQQRGELPAPDQHAQSAKIPSLSTQQMDNLLYGIMMTESGGNASAYNKKSGATGAYQFMEGTGRDMGLRIDSQVDERLDPEKSRAAAAIYMRQMLKRYNGDIDNALRAYNWGMGNVDKWIARGSNPAELPQETLNYTGKVHGHAGSSRNYYATQGRLADSRPYQLSSIGGNQVTNSTYINNVNVNSNPQSASALTKSVEEIARRSSTNGTFSSGVN